MDIVSLICLIILNNILHHQDPEKHQTCMNQCTALIGRMDPEQTPPNKFCFKKSIDQINRAIGKHNIDHNRYANVVDAARGMLNRKSPVLSEINDLIALNETNRERFDYIVDHSRIDRIGLSHLFDHHYRRCGFC